jgi:hypothetical protein
MILTKTEKRQLSLPYTRLFIKLFKTYDPVIIQQCQYYMYCMPLDYIIDLRTINFLAKLATVNNFYLNVFYRQFGVDKVLHLLQSYNLGLNSDWKSTMWTRFESLAFM